VEFWDVLDTNGNKTGKIIERGELFTKDEYHLVVHVWLKNSNNEFLISKRTPNKTFPNMWDTVGGSAIAGESSIIAAVREVEEEIGLKLNKNDGHLITRLKRNIYAVNDFVDVWIFLCEAKISELIYKPDEVNDAKWADKDTIKDMIKRGIMVDVYTYIEEVFNYVP